MVADLLNWDQNFVNMTGLHAFRVEARLLLLLRHFGALTIKDAMSLADTSYRGFYDMLRRMVDRDIVKVVEDDRDGRVRRLVLQPTATDLLHMLAQNCDRPTEMPAHRIVNGASGTDNSVVA